MVDGGPCRKRVRRRCGMVANWHRVSTMAMGQHYGIPTYRLDVTESLQTA